ncbi:MAG TPA: GGDEF domain-containing protein [Vicinamibacteria bacterium]|nr:GGDEF domain-containing protein [Vicinamibacteria bacterium]
MVETIPKRQLYPLLGFFLALGAPGGLLVLRGLVLGRLLSADWVVSELADRPITYGYMAVSTALMFVGLGFILGANEDLLKKMSMTDALTGLANRRQFDKRLREEVARVDRYGQRLTLMLLDLDELKNLNDQKGHEAGDNAIRAVARTMQHNCRATDLAARIGGDEFGLIAPGITMTDALTVAERIQRSLRTEASWVASELPPLTLSIGIADTSCTLQLDPDRLYAAADGALYRAKEQGRDRVLMAPVRDERVAETP